MHYVLQSMTLRCHRLLLPIVCASHFVGVSTIAVSKDPVYNGEPVTLTCTHAIDDVIVWSVTMEADNETRNVGTLVCSPASGTTFQNTGAGRFAGIRFTGCETKGVESASVSISASPSWELDYTCTFEIIFKSTRIHQNVTSASTRLSVWGMCLL